MAFRLLQPLRYSGSFVGSLRLLCLVGLLVCVLRPLSEGGGFLVHALAWTLLDRGGM